MKTGRMRDSFAGAFQKQRTGRRPRRIIRDYLHGSPIDPTPAPPSAESRNPIPGLTGLVESHTTTTGRSISGTFNVISNNRFRAQKCYLRLQASWATYPLSRAIPTFLSTVSSFPAKVVTEARILIDGPHDKRSKDRPKVENGPGVRRPEGKKEA